AAVEFRLAPAPPLEKPGHVGAEPPRQVPDEREGPGSEDLGRFGQAGSADEEPGLRSRLRRHGFGVLEGTQESVMTSPARQGPVSSSVRQSSAGGGTGPSGGGPSPVSAAASSSTKLEDRTRTRTSRTSPLA